MTLKIIDSFIATVDPKRAAVISFPEFILIFGGALSKSARSKPKTKRDAFLKWVKEHRKDLAELLKLPESYTEWKDFDTYSDLLLFEKDLAYLTGAVLVFLESPGSIAELGAFSQINSLSERLMVVIEDGHYRHSSFINLGPIRSIEFTQKHQHCVCVIPDGKPADLVAHINIVIETLDKKRHRPVSSQALNSENEQHQMLLILDLIGLFSVIQATELQRLAAHFGIELKLARLNQILFVLQKTELIFKVRYGDVSYYLPSRSRQAYVDFTSNASSPAFSRLKLKAGAWNEIEKRDKNRKYAHELEKSRRSRT